MSVIVIGNTKGGTGKSTLAVNLCIEFAKYGKVMLFDADDQQTSWDFSTLRYTNMGQSRDYDARKCTDRTIYNKIINNSGYYQYIIIDAGGRDTEALRAALVVAKLVIIPVQPRATDLWAIQVMADIVNEARKRNPKIEANLLLNMSDPQGKKNENALFYLKGEFGMRGLGIFDTTIGRRIVFDNAFNNGQGIGEYLPKDQKAIDEMTTLVSCIKNKLGEG